MSIKYCAVCGVELPENRANHRKYCSKACLRKHEANKRIDYISNRAKRINKVAHSIYRAYDYKCALCGWQASEELISFKGKIQYAHGNDIHHIIQMCDGGTEDPDNVILLCPNHHRQADLGLISIEELQKHTRSYELTEKEKARAISECADVIAKAIFG